MEFSKVQSDKLDEALKKAKSRKIRRPDEEQRYARMEHMAESEGSVSQLGMERVLGDNDLFYLNYLERGLLAARPVCRISVMDDPFKASHGTGFMVSPNLMLTNNHVLADRDTAAGAFCEFQYEIDSARRPRRAIRFHLMPQAGFVTNKEKDFTLVALEAASEDDSHTLDQFGFLRLAARSNKITEGEFVTIVQHPDGGYKKIAMRENKLIKYGGEKGFDSFLWYFCDTAPGSSGSPVFNDSWQVVALHHAGVPIRETKSGKTLYKTRSNGFLTKADIAKRGLEGDIVWIANEGVRISRIIADLAEKHQAEDRGELIGALLADAHGTTPFPNVMPGASVVGPAFGERSWGSEAVTAPRRDDPDLGFVDRDSQGCRMRTIPYYQRRKGYQPDFLGDDVPLPEISDRALAHGRPADVEGADDNVLRYHHFSVVMNADRRLAYFTAVNIDGARSRRVVREGKDVWCFDPRVSRSNQAGNELYKSEIWVDRQNKKQNNWFDRGHLVRWEDPVWGSETEAAEAEIDTFQWTNCAPQYFTFNQQWWLGLEKYVLNSVDNDDLRASVFNGPVFLHDDEEHRGMRIPQYYWKLVVVRDEKSKLLASAFILDQKKFARDLPFEKAPVEDFGGFQTSVTKLEAATGLNFGDTVRAADVRGKQPGDDVPIRSLEDVTVRRGG